MSAGQESSADSLIAVACVVDASLVLAREWPRVLMDYVYPLLKRLNELHPSHQFRLAFVTYGAADTRPSPLLSKRFFVPLSLILKELREEPSKLGIGQTNSGSGRGLSALEGLVAAIELFDILMTSPNFAGNHAPTQSPQKENRSLIPHLLHIAASPPDNAQRPQQNTLSHLDSVNWDSIPAELKKRKINLSLISLMKIPQFQDLQSSVAGSGAQSPWFNVRAPHILLLAGFPAPQKMDQSPDAKRQKIIAEPISKTSSASPALSPARIPQNQRPQQPISLQAQQPQPQPTTAASQRSSSTQPVQAATSAPASTSATATPSTSLPPSGPSISIMNSEVLEQVVTQTGLKFGQVMERLKVLEREIEATKTQISDAQNAGQTAIASGFQKELADKTHIKDQIKLLLKRHYQNMLLAKGASNAQQGVAGSTLPGSAEAGPSAQAHPSNMPSASSERPISLTTEEHQPAVPDSLIVAQFWQSRGGTISAPNDSNMIEKNGIQPQSLGPPSGTTSHVTGANSNTTNPQVPTISAWHGTFSLSFPKLSDQVMNEVQMHVHVLGMSSSNIRTDTWPKNLTLNPCKEPLKDNTELPSWLKRHKARTRLMQFKPNPRAPDGPVNEQKFHTLYKLMAERRVFAYTGWQSPQGKFSQNIVIFSANNHLLGAVFPDGLPDLPGSGNGLDVQPSVDGVKPQPLSGLSIPPALMARMQGLEPAQRKQFLAQFLLAHQEQLRKLQQAQQSHTAASQSLNSLGISMSSNPYNTVTNVAPGLHVNPNVNMSANSGTYNAGGGTVNYEMLRSFMHRSAEGSTSQGMNSS